jgi:transposase
MFYFWRQIMTNNQKRFIGLDLAKRTVEVCIRCEGELPQRMSGIRTDEQGRERLASLLRSDDVVGMEACSIAFLLGRYLRNTVGCTVYILNPGKLQLIWKSTRKTDKEDAAKIASFIMRNPEEELPLVSLPTEQEEVLRSLVSMKQFLTALRTRLINRLHALYVQAGITGLKKSNLARAEGREQQRAALAGEAYILIAESLERELETTEKELGIYKETIDCIVRDSALTPYILSIPGVGPGLAAAFLAYIGDGKRFTKPAEVANYVGLVPRVDCSGETNRYGNILPGGNRALRSIILQCAWALVRSGNGGRLQEKYLELTERMSKTKSAVAIARRMITLMWILVTRREYYKDITKAELLKKLRYYKLTSMAWEALAS